MDDKTLENIQSSFSAGYADEKLCEETIGRIFRDFGYLCDPHTAVAFAVLEQCRASGLCKNRAVVLSTASPYKFPAAVLSAIGGDMSGDEFEQMERLSAISGVAIPGNLSGLREARELHLDVIDKDALIAYVSQVIEQGGL